VIHAQQYFAEVADIASLIDRQQLALLADEISQIKGRLFIVGLGGSAANASHAAADFRKLAGIEAYCLSDNVSDLTARANDDGWHSMYYHMLNDARARHYDALLVLSVGGGTKEVSLPIVGAMDYAQIHRMKILGIVGRDGGHTKKHGDCVVVVPTVSDERVTPHTEAFQSVILHYLVSHPAIQKRKTKW
jgi:D-sedoheptulose 7-phosphate isomerase